MRQTVDFIKGIVRRLSTLLKSFRTWWRSLREVNRYIVLIAATLALSKAVVIREGLSGHFWTIAAVLGTVLAAVAAYRTAEATQETLKRQIRLDNARERPYVRIVEAKPLKSREVELIIINFSQLPVHIFNTGHIHDEQGKQAIIPSQAPNIVVTTGATEKLKVPLNLTDHGEHDTRQLFFNYRYASTGEVVYTVYLAFSYFYGQPKTAYFFFKLDEQKTIESFDRFLEVPFSMPTRQGFVEFDDEA